MCRALLAVALTALGITGCRNTVEPVDPQTYTIQEVMERQASEGDLYAEAVMASGLYDDLSPSDYPFLLISFYEEEALTTYIAEQGLSEKAFLVHPKLREFMENHLIPSSVDTVKIRSTPNGRFTYTSAAGSEVVFTTGEDLEQTPERLNVAKANGVPFSPYCYEVGSTDDGERLCTADRPIIQDFDWSK